MNINLSELWDSEWQGSLARCSPAAAAAAAKSLQSCPTLGDPIDGSPPGSSVPGILQARTLEWVAISFSNAWNWKVKVKSLSRVRLLASPWAAAHQAPLFMGFSRQEYCSGLPLLSAAAVHGVTKSQTWLCNWTTRSGGDNFQFTSVQSLNPVQLFATHELQHTKLPCPSPTPGVYSNSRPSSLWCHPTISSSVVPFSSCPQSFPASGSFQMSEFLESGGQRIGASTSTSVLPMNIQDWFPLGWTGWISL